MSTKVKSRKTRKNINRLLSMILAIAFSLTTSGGTVALADETEAAAEIQEVVVLSEQEEALELPILDESVAGEAEVDSILPAEEDSEANDGDAALPIKEGGEESSLGVCVISGTNEIVGTELKDKMFTFHLTQVTNQLGVNILAGGHSDIAKIMGSGGFSFGLKDLEIGEYFYRISQDQIGNGVDGWLYDNRFMVARVSVAKIDGVVKTEVTYPTGDRTFVNTKVVAPGEAYEAVNLFEFKAASESDFYATRVGNEVISISGSDGARPTFCLDRQTDFIPGSDYLLPDSASARPITDPRVLYILDNAYPVLTRAQTNFLWDVNVPTDDAMYWAVQYAIWNFTNSGHVAEIDEQSKKWPAAVPLYKLLVAAAGTVTSYTPTSERFKYEFVGSDTPPSSLSDDGTIRFGPYKLTLSNKALPLPKELKIEVSAAGAPGGFEVCNAAGAPYGGNKADLNTDFYVHFNAWESADITLNFALTGAFLSIPYLTKAVYLENTLASQDLLYYERGGGTGPASSQTAGIKYDPEATPSTLKLELKKVTVGGTHLPQSDIKFPVSLHVVKGTAVVAPIPGTYYICESEGATVIDIPTDIINEYFGKGYQIAVVEDWLQYTGKTETHGGVEYIISHATTTAATGGLGGGMRYYSPTSTNFGANTLTKPITGEYKIGYRFSLDNLNGAQKTITFTNTLTDVLKPEPVIRVIKNAAAAITQDFTFHLYELTGTSTHTYIGSFDLARTGSIDIFGMIKTYCGTEGYYGRRFTIVEAFANTTSASTSWGEEIRTTTASASLGITGTQGFYSLGTGVTPSATRSSGTTWTVGYPYRGIYFTLPDTDAGRNSTFTFTNTVTPHAFPAINIRKAFNKNDTESLYPANHQFTFNLYHVATNGVYTFIDSFKLASGVATVDLVDIIVKSPKVSTYIGEIFVVVEDFKSVYNNKGTSYYTTTTGLIGFNAADGKALSEGKDGTYTPESYAAKNAITGVSSNNQYPAYGFTLTNTTATATIVFTNISETYKMPGLKLAKANTGAGNSETAGDKFKFNLYSVNGSVYTLIEKDILLGRGQDIDLTSYISKADPDYFNKTFAIIEKFPYDRGSTSDWWKSTEAARTRTNVGIGTPVGDEFHVYAYGSVPDVTATLNTGGFTKGNEHNDTNKFRGVEIKLPAPHWNVTATEIVTFTNTESDASSNRLHIKKLDEAGKATLNLTDAVFDIYEYESGDLPGGTVEGRTSLQTLNNGNGFMSDDLKRDETYTIVETKAPAGTVKDVEGRIMAVVTMNRELVIQEVEIKNQRIGNIEIHKTKSKEQDQLAGADFELYNWKGDLYSDYEGEEPILCFTTESVDPETGDKIEGLNYGKYALIEVKAPTNYKLDDDFNKRVTVVNINVAEQSIKIINHPEDASRRNIELLKVDSMTWKKWDKKSVLTDGILGAVFRTQASTDNGKTWGDYLSRGDLTSSVTGVYTNVSFDSLGEDISGFNVGKYRTHETQVPAGYKPTGDIYYYFDITKDDDGAIFATPLLKGNAAGPFSGEAAKVYMSDGKYVIPNDFVHSFGEIVLTKELDGNYADWGVNSSTEFIARVFDMTNDRFVIFNYNSSDGSYSYLDHTNSNEPSSDTREEIKINTGSPVILKGLWENCQYEIIEDGGKHYTTTYEGNKAFLNGQMNVTIANKYEHDTGSMIVSKKLEGFPEHWAVNDNTMFKARVVDTYSVANKKTTLLFIRYDDAKNLYFCVGHETAEGVQNISAPDYVAEHGKQEVVDFIEFSAGKAATIENLWVSDIANDNDPLTYEVVEYMPNGKDIVPAVESEDFHYSVSYEYLGHGSNKNSFPQGVEGGNLLINVTNTFKEGVGSLMVHKILSGSHKDWGVDETSVFYIRVKDLTGENGDGSIGNYVHFYKQSDGTYKADGNSGRNTPTNNTLERVPVTAKQAVELTNLWSSVAGNQYQVEEETGAHYTTVYEGNPVTLVGDSDNETVTITNTYEHGVGNLNITKRLMGFYSDWGIGDDEVFYARVKDVNADNGDGTFGNYVHFYKQPNGTYYADGNSGTTDPSREFNEHELVEFSPIHGATLTNLWSGLDYEIEEVSGPNYQISYSPEVISFKEGQSATVQVTNYYEHDIGSLIIQKSLIGSYADWDVDNSTEFKVRIKDISATQKNGKDNFLMFKDVPDADGGYWCVGNIDEDGFKRPSEEYATPIDVLIVSVRQQLVVKNLWANYDYEVVEVNEDDVPYEVSYSPRSIFLAGEAGASYEGDNQFIIVTNTFKTGLANARISGEKTYEDESAGGRNKEFKFDLVQVEDSIGTPMTTDTPYTDSTSVIGEGGFTFELTDLKVGGTYYYEIKENLTDNGKDHWIYDTHSMIAKVEVEHIGGGVVEAKTTIVSPMGSEIFHNVRPRQNNPAVPVTPGGGGGGGGTTPTPTPSSNPTPTPSSAPDSSDPSDDPSNPSDDPSNPSDDPSNPSDSPSNPGGGPSEPTQVVPGSRVPEGVLPGPSKPTNTITVDENGTFIEFNEDGVPLGRWSKNSDDEWILLGENGVPLGKWVHDNIDDEWLFFDEDVPLGRWTPAAVPLGVSSSAPTTAPTVFQARRLPQTGVSAWIVPILAVAGLLIMLLGWFLLRKKRKVQE